MAKTDRELSTAVRDIPTYRVLQTIQMKLRLLCVWAERAVLGFTHFALKFKYKIKIGYHIYNSMFGAGYKLEK